jgi:outer membrane assembly lipoprotein YfiO
MNQGRGLYRWLLVLIVGIALAPSASAGKWVWTPDTGWQDINKLPRETPQQRYNYAVALATDGKYESALVAFEDLLKHFPKTEFAEGSEFYIGFCRKHSGDFWGAYKAIEALFQAFPKTKFREAAMRIEVSAGRELAHMGDARGLQILDVVIQRDPQGPSASEAQLEKGHYYFSQSRYQEARGAYQTLVARYPGSAQMEMALFRRAECDLRITQQDPKNQAALRGAQIGFKDYLAQYPKGQWSANAVEYADVLDRLSKAKSADDVEFFRAFLDYDQGRYAQACPSFKRLAWRFWGAELGEQSQYYYADCLAHMGQTRAAFKALEKIFGKYGMGMMGRKAVEREFSLAKELRKTNSGWATWAFGRVVANDPNGPLAADAQIEMANTYFEQKDCWNAKTAYQTVTTAYPDSAWAPLALFRTGVCTLEEARIVNVPTALLNEAQSKLEDYVGRYPEGANIEEAKTRLTEIQDMKAQIAFDTAKWYWGRGKRDSAVIYFRSIVKEYPETKWAAEARKAISKLRPEATGEGT